MVIDMQFAANGNLFVLQHSTGAVQGAAPGKIVRIEPDRSQSDICAQYQRGTRVDAVSGLARPTALAIGPDGALYISHRGNNAGTGQVIRIVH